MKAIHIKSIFLVFMGALGMLIVDRVYLVPKLAIPYPVHGNAVSSVDSNQVTEKHLKVAKVETPNPLQSLVKPVHKTSENMQIVQWDGTSWVVLSDYCAGNYTFEKTTLRTSFGETPMFIHNVKDDRWVSGALKDTGMWDGGNANALAQQLQKDPSLGLLDIGAQLGTHTLMASLLKRNVVAVDPLEANVRRLCKSLEAGKFTNNVTVIFNALSDSYKKISFVLDKGNIGGTRIQASDPNLKDSNTNDGNSLYTALLDDLLPFVTFKQAVMKLDVESHEMQVIRGGAKLLSQIDVRAILMEWMFHKNSGGDELWEAMVHLGYKPFIPHNYSPLLNVNHRGWPNDVLWLK